MTFTVKRYQHLLICELGGNIEGPENNSKVERGCTVYLGGLVIIKRTADDAALVMALARIGIYVFEEVVNPRDAHLQIYQIKRFQVSVSPISGDFSMSYDRGMEEEHDGYEVHISCTKNNKIVTWLLEKHLVQ